MRNIIWRKIICTWENVYIDTTSTLSVQKILNILILIEIGNRTRTVEIYLVHISMTRNCHCSADTHYVSNKEHYYIHLYSQSNNIILFSILHKEHVFIILVTQDSEVLTIIII